LTDDALSVDSKLLARGIAPATSLAGAASRRRLPATIQEMKVRWRMSIKSLMTSSPDLAEPDESAYQAAVRMRQRAVGSLVIVDDAYAAIGMITDRDLVERVLAAGKDPNATRLADIMSQSPVTIGYAADVGHALRLMQQHSVRRLPVVDDLGRVCGVVALDDILAAFADNCQGVAQLLKSEMPRGIAEATSSRWD
jgi:CBS domain-containing protein